MSGFGRFGGEKKGDRVILTNCHMITRNHKSFDPRVAALYSLSLRPQNVSVLNTRPQSFDLIDRMESEISLIERVNVSSGRHVSDSISFNEAGAQWLLKEKKQA